MKTQRSENLNTQIIRMYSFCLSVYSSMLYTIKIKLSVKYTYVSAFNFSKIILTYNN